MNKEMLALTTPRFGTLEGRYVLYLGEDIDTEDGIAYRNAENFLNSLPNISLTSGLEKGINEDEEQGSAVNYRRRNHGKCRYSPPRKCRDS